MKDRLIITALAFIAAFIVTVIFLTYGRIAHTPIVVKPSSATSTEKASGSIPFTIIAQGPRSTVTTRVNYFITSATELAELWPQLEAGGTVPTINFLKDDLLALFAGQQPTGGFSIRISGITDGTSTRTVDVVIDRPNSKCPVAQTLTQPFVLVVVPHTVLPLTHENVTATAPCPTSI